VCVCVCVCDVLCSHTHLCGQHSRAFSAGEHLVRLGLCFTAEVVPLVHS
jgi:hypothetical protein